MKTAKLFFATMLVSMAALQGCSTPPTQTTLNNVGVSIATSYRALAATRLAIVAAYTNGALSAVAANDEIVKQAKLRSALDLGLALSQLQGPLPDLADVQSAQQVDDAALAALQLALQPPPK